MSETSPEPVKKQHIVKREDGSILIINYEQFNKLISSSDTSKNESSSLDSSSSSFSSSDVTSKEGSMHHLKSTVKSLNLFNLAAEMDMDPNYTILSFEQLINNLNGSRDPAPYFG